MVRNTGMAHTCGIGIGETVYDTTVGDELPVDTSSELVFYLYIVRENAQSSLAGALSTQTYMVFASGHTLYRGEARYDVHHWNFSNFS